MQAEMPFEPASYARTKTLREQVSRLSHMSSWYNDWTTALLMVMAIVLALLDAFLALPVPALSAVSQLFYFNFGLALLAVLSILSVSGLTEFWRQRFDLATMPYNKVDDRPLATVLALLGVVDILLIGWVWFNVVSYTQGTAFLFFGIVVIVAYTVSGWLGHRKWRQYVEAHPHEA